MVTEAGKRAFGQSQHVTDATMRARDVIYEGLLIRRGLELTEEVARERANNIATAVIEALRQLAEESKPPPIRPAPEPFVRPDQCPKNKWCCDEPGHDGECCPPF